jgi:hypothetical protein
MTSLPALLSKWPLMRQIRERADDTSLEAISDKTGDEGNNENS